MPIFAKCQSVWARQGNLIEGGSAHLDPPFTLWRIFRCRDAGRVPSSPPDLASGRSNTGLAATDYCNYRHYRQNVRFADNDCYSYISDCSADALHRKGPGAIRALKDITQAGILIQAVAQVSRQGVFLKVWEEALGRGEGGPTPFINGHARLSDQAGARLPL